MKSLERYFYQQINRTVMKIFIHNQGSDNRGRNQMPIDFKSHGGYVPVIQMRKTFRKYQTNFFHSTRADYIRVSTRTKDRLYLAGNMASKTFKTPARNGRHGDAPSIMTGYMTALMIKEAAQYTMSSLNINTRPHREFRLENEIDVMILGLYKMSKIKDITSEIYTGPYYRSEKRVLDSAHMKFLVSPKLYDSKWMKANYSIAIKKNLLDVLIETSRDYSIPIEKVSDEEIYRYIKVFSTIQTNSLMEIMQIDNEIKDAVFNVKLEEALVG
jgi:hypothetical protein